MTRLTWCALLVAGASLATLAACSGAGEPPDLHDDELHAGTEEVPDVMLVRRMVEHFHDARTIRVARDSATASVPTLIEAKRLDDGSVVTRMEFSPGVSPPSIYLLHCELAAQIVYWYQPASDPQAAFDWEVSARPVDDASVPVFATEYPDSLFFGAVDAGTRTVDGLTVRGLTSDRLGGPATFWLTDDDRLTFVDIESNVDAFTFLFEYDVALDVEVPEVADPPGC